MSKFHAGVSRALLIVAMSGAGAWGMDYPRAPIPRGNAASYTGFTLGFAVEGRDPSWRQIPLQDPYDRRYQGWWDNAVAEASIAQVDFVAPVTRGCNPCSKGDDPGNSCPLDLNLLVTALHGSKAAHKPKAALFVDTGGAFTAIKNICKHGSERGPLFDFADQNGTGEGGWQYFWDADIKKFYETIPSADLFTVDGRPVIYFWSVAPVWFANQNGNLSKFLQFIRDSVKSEVGADPFIIVDRTWADLDPTVTPAVADGVNDWFDPTVSGCTVRDWGGRSFAVSVPGFRDRDGTQFQRNLPRNGGGTLRNCLSMIRQQGTFMTLLEGLTNVEESAGFYRSKDPDWANNPNLYLDIVRGSLSKTPAMQTDWSALESRLPLRPPWFDRESR